MPLLHHLEQATGLVVRKQPLVRCEVFAPGKLVHVDVKKLGRIPDGGGYRKLGRAMGAAAWAPRSFTIPSTTTRD